MLTGRMASFWILLTQILPSKCFVLHINFDNNRCPFLFQQLSLTEAVASGLRFWPSSTRVINNKPEIAVLCIIWKYCGRSLKFHAWKFWKIWMLSILFFFPSESLGILTQWLLIKHLKYFNYFTHINKIMSLYCDIFILFALLNVGGILLRYLARLFEGKGNPKTILDLIHTFFISLSIKQEICVVKVIHL